MTGEIAINITKTFKLSFPTCTNENIFFNLEVPIEIPHNGSTRELVQRIIKMFHIPVFLEEDLNDELAAFVAKETKQYHNDRDEKLLNQLKNGEINVESLVKNWEKAFKDNVVEYAEQKGTSDEEVFAAAYHKLVHSPAVETILQVENSYATTVLGMINNRDKDIKKLTKSQTDEMEEKVRLLNTFSTEEDINELAAKHFEEQSLVAGRWGSQIDALWQTQRTEYRAWIMKTLEEYQSSSALNTPSSPLGTFSAPLASASASAADGDTGTRLEDSFTIHLGSQLKQTHNVRILAAHVLDLCRPHTDRATEASRRLQTALGVYSGELCGLVLVAAGAPPRLAPLTQQFAELCRASTEHHFPDIDHQVRLLAADLKEPVERRNAAELEAGTAVKRTSVGGLRTGDVFVTRHSNLADTHVVYHLVADDSDLKSGDINSRHPAILGLRNILKMACSNDVTSICLPVLLRHEMSDEMTAAWCVRRAELVLKCVKGFMLEAAAWGGSELRCVQFLLPGSAAPHVFSTLAALLPAIFRLSTPLKFNSSS